MNENGNPAVAVFAESCLPNLRCGEYRLRAVHSTKQFRDSVTAEQAIRVEGPRFVLSPEDIQSVYPPAGMTGSFAVSLPHAVFSRKTLPWERSLDHAARIAGIQGNGDPVPDMAEPWMAVLTFAGSEMPEVQTGTVRDMRTAPGDVYVPPLGTRGEELEQNCRYIEIDRKFFLNIVPRREELALLCHARSADPSLKADNEYRDDGYRAVVIGNRLPASLPGGTACMCCLVSLEGFGNFTADKLLLAAKRVRLTVLHSWKFVAVTQKLHLEELFAGLDVGDLKADIPAAGAALRNVLANGFSPHPHLLRNGDRTVSLYRGPLVPVAGPMPSLPALNADALYRYDPDAGVFDISHAAAWQLGRLLVLSNRRLAVKIMRHRIASHRGVSALWMRSCVREQFRRENSPAGSVPAPESIGKSLLLRLEETLAPALEKMQ